jgi:hypothetical protein
MDLEEPRRIGFWKETLDDSYPFAQELVGEYPTEQRESVASYLESCPEHKRSYNGMRLSSFLGYSRCRICGIPNGSCEYWDGSWLWPSGLAHYVRDHSVMLPPDFVAHACRADAIRSLGPETSEYTEKAGDISYWLAWATGQRHPRVAALVDEARQSAVPGGAADALARIASEALRLRQAAG